MHAHRSVLPLLTVLTAATAGIAQDPAPVNAAPPRGPLSDALRVPVHRGSDAHGPDYGIWAAGPGFKASFHDGFAFYPELGAAYPEDLPLHWRTTMVGDATAVLAAPTMRTSDWQVVLEHAGWREVYDVRPGGVEQSFVVDRRPAGSGDLVIAGQITTRLLCARAGRAHQRLVFHDGNGRPLVEYGYAFAIDAAGRRFAVDTSFDGEHVVLTVDGAWLAQAQFPLTVDPLTAPVVLNQLASATVDTTDVCTEPTGATTRDTVTVFSRVFSATDHDVMAILSRSDFGNGVPIFSDLSRGSSDKNVTVAFVAGTANRFLIGFQRDAQVAEIRIYFHDRGNTNFNSGRTIVCASQAHHRHPDLGGTSATTGTRGVLVYEAEYVGENGDHTLVLYTMIDAAQRTLGFTNGANSGYGMNTHDCQAPAVNQTAAGDGWLIVSQELNRAFPGSPAYLMGSLITASGSMRARSPIAVSATDGFAQPRVAGAAGNFMVTCVRSHLLSTQLQAMPTRWALADPTPTVAAAQTLASASLPSTLTNHGLAHDAVDGAFFGATYVSASSYSRTPLASAYVLRLSGSGRVVEAATLYAEFGFSASAPSVTFSRALPGFPACCASNDAGRTLSGRALVYGAGATATRYGAGCGGAVIDATRPLAGSQSFRVAITNAVPGTATFLFGSTAAGSLALGGLGMTGCELLIDPARTWIVVPGATDQAGYGASTVPLPDNPLFTGDLFFQYLYVAPTANPARMAATGGLCARVR